MGWSILSCRPLIGVLAAMSLMSGVIGATDANNQTPLVLLHAVRCLAAKNFLQVSRTKTSAFGYYLDDKSYPGDVVFYVVQYAKPTQSDGVVFAVFLKESNKGQVFNVQNNASFLFTKHKREDVTFDSPPLGGAWTQDHLASAVRQIEKKPRFAIAAKDLSATGRDFRCEAYTDPQRP